MGEGKKYETDEVNEIIKKIDVTPRLDPRSRAILARYIFDMKSAMSEVARVLVPKGEAVYVVGENTLRGTYIRTSAILTAIAARIGLQLVDRKDRILPANRRYLPPPERRKGSRLNLRMRREVIISFKKSSHSQA